MRISFRGVKKSNGSTVLLSLGLIFAFSLVMTTLVSWINRRYEKVKKESKEFYNREYIIPSEEKSVETF